MIAVTGAAFMAGGCSTIASPKVITVEERIKLDDSLGIRLAESFESQVRTRKIPKNLIPYFHDLAALVASSKPELKASSFRVFIIRDRQNIWQNFALPGNRIYLSEGFLKNAHFENEIIASIALEFGHLLHRHLIREVELSEQDRRRGEASADPAEIAAAADVSGNSVNFFGKTGLFNFSEKDQLEATETAVGLMYQAGYDPRGLLSVWQKLQKNRKNSPYESKSIVKFVEKTHQAIAAFSPLRNPVISSEEFLKNKNRIERL